MNGQQMIEKGRVDPSSRSIFDGVARNENSYTNLLRNLMLRDEPFCERVMNLLLPGEIRYLRGTRIDIQTQVFIGDSKECHGQVDMLIETDDVVLIVEVKVDRTCELMDNQRLSQDKGYLAYLRDSVLTDRSKAIAFLVPGTWKYIGDTRNSLSQVGAGISGNLTTWEKISGIIDKADDGFVREFLLLLERDFMEISLSEDERKLLGSLGPHYSKLTMKLHELLRRSEAELSSIFRMRGLAFQSEWSLKQVGEYGYQVNLGKRSLFWVGIWSVSEFPLVVAVDENWSGSADTLARLGSLGLQSRQHKKWRIFDLNSVLIEDDPTLALIRVLAKISPSVVEVEVV